MNVSPISNHPYFIQPNYSLEKLRNVLFGKNHLDRSGAISKNSPLKKIKAVQIRSDIISDWIERSTKVKIFDIKISFEQLVNALHKTFGNVEVFGGNLPIDDLYFEGVSTPKDLHLLFKSVISLRKKYSADIDLRIRLPHQSKDSIEQAKYQSKCFYQLIDVLRKQGQFISRDCLIKNGLKNLVLFDDLQSSLVTIGEVDIILFHGDVAPHTSSVDSISVPLNRGSIFPQFEEGTTFPEWFVHTLAKVFYVKYENKSVFKRVAQYSSFGFMTCQKNVIERLFLQFASQCNFTKELSKRISHLPNIIDAKFSFILSVLQWVYQFMTKNEKFAFYRATLRLIKPVELAYHPLHQMLMKVDSGKIPSILDGLQWLVWVIPNHARLSIQNGELYWEVTTSGSFSFYLQADPKKTLNRILNHNMRWIDPVLNSISLSYSSSRKLHVKKEPIIKLLAAASDSHFLIKIHTLATICSEEDLEVLKILKIYYKDKMKICSFLLEVILGVLKIDMDKSFLMQFVEFIQSKPKLIQFLKTKEIVCTEICKSLCKYQLFSLALQWSRLISIDITSMQTAPNLYSKKALDLFFYLVERNPETFKSQLMAFVKRSLSSGRVDLVEKVLTIENKGSIHYQLMTYYMHQNQLEEALISLAKTRKKMVLEKSTENVYYEQIILKYLEMDKVFAAWKLYQENRKYFEWKHYEPLWVAVTISLKKKHIGSLWKEIIEIGRSDEGLSEKMQKQRSILIQRCLRFSMDSNELFQKKYYKYFMKLFFPSKRKVYQSRDLFELMMSSREFQLIGKPTPKASVDLAKILYIRSISSLMRDDLQGKKGLFEKKILYLTSYHWKGIYSPQLFVKNSELEKRVRAAFEYHAVNPPWKKPSDPHGFYKQVMMTVLFMIFFSKVTLYLYSTWLEDDHPPFG